MFPQNDDKTCLNITTKGHKYLGSFIGTEEGKKEFIDAQLNDWISDIKDLCEAAKTEPHLAFSAYLYGTSKRWNFILRTTPSISDQLKKIEEVISEMLIPALTGRKVSQEYRDIFTLPVRLGGLAIEDPSKISDREYKNSHCMTKYRSKTTFEVKQHLVLLF